MSLLKCWWPKCFGMLFLVLAPNSVWSEVFFPSAERALELYEQCVDATSPQDLEQYEVPARVETHNAIRLPFDTATRMVQNTLAEWEQRCLDRKSSLLDQ